MPAECQRNDGHHQQRQHLQTHAFGTHKDHQQCKRDHQRRQVHLMTIWQHQWLRGDLPAQLTKCHNRTGKSHRTDEDTEEHFGQVNINQNRLHARFVVEIAVETHQYRRQTHKAVQDRHQLRHFGHFNAFCETNTDGSTDNHRHQNPRHVAGVRPEDGGNQRNRHPGDTKVIPLLRRFVFGKPRKAENKQDRSNNVCGCD